MANFRKRSNKWQARVQRKNYPSRTKTFVNLNDAKLWSRKIERSYDLGILHNETSPIKLEEAFKRYLNEINPRKKRHDIERYRIQSWLKHPLSQSYLQNISVQDLSGWVEEKIKCGLKANTIRLHLAVLSHLYSIAEKEWGYEILKNPTIHLYRPKISLLKISRVANHEIKLLIKNTQSFYLPYLIKFALETAMRRSEIINLQWHHIDWSRQLISVEASKNGLNRIVPLTNNIKKILHSCPTKHTKIFPITEHAVSVAFRRAVIRSGLTKISFHTLRHEAISRFFEMGLNPMEVATISGHKSMQMLKHYTHIKPEYLLKKINGE